MSCLDSGVKSRRTDLHAGFGCIHNAACFRAGVDDDAECSAGRHDRVRPGRVLDVQRILTSPIHLTTSNRSLRTNSTSTALAPCA